MQFDIINNRKIRISTFYMQLHMELNHKSINRLISFNFIFDTVGLVTILTSVGYNFNAIQYMSYRSIDKHVNHRKWKLCWLLAIGSISSATICEKVKIDLYFMSWYSFIKAQRENIVVIFTMVTAGCWIQYRSLDKLILYLDFNNNYLILFNLLQYLPCFAYPTVLSLYRMTNTFDHVC